MIDSSRGILLDIEGTTSSISFVYDQMFPYVRRELGNFLNSQWDRAQVKEAVHQLANDAGFENSQAWASASTASASDASCDLRAVVTDQVIHLMDDDVKSTGLKMLQGLIWEAGFESGELEAHIFPDLLPALQQWHAADHDIRIYSSGSVHAQKLFFGHTTAGNLLSFFRGHYDTTTGPKRESESYQKIAEDFQLPASQITFYSDVVAELEAARSAGMKTRLCLRPGNAPVEDGLGHEEITSFI